MWPKTIRLLPVFTIILLSFVILGFEEPAAFGQNTGNVGDSGQTGSSPQVYIASSASLRGCETTNSCYSPYEKHVEAGTTITWNNQDAVPHTITSGIPLEGPDVIFDSNLIQAGNTFLQTFDEPGSFPYFCMVHPWMTGIVVVTEKVPSQDSEPVVEQPEKSYIDVLSVYFQNSSPHLGNEFAPITLVQFGDYQGFFEKKFFKETKEMILKNYVDTGKIKIIFKDYTIIGPDSISAANAAHCAGEQGKYWEYHDVLLKNSKEENKGWASYENLIKFANKIGLD